jgi:DNA-binding SARP family transcriptional activator
MSTKVTYHQQISFCGKPRCHKCNTGIGHGPYWYAYKTVNGRTTRTYIGKTLPPDVQPEQIQTWIAGRPAQDDDPSVLRVSMLGRFELERRVGRNWQTVEAAPWHHQRQRLLFALLLLSPGRKLGREQIMEALWPGLDPETAAARLDRTVHALRRILEPSLPRASASHLLRTEHEGLVLADQHEIWVDSDAFECLLTQAHEEQRAASEREHLLEEAVALYANDLLPEMADVPWVVTRRDMLRRHWMGALLELADLRLAREAYAAVIEPMDRLLAADDTNEAAVQRLIIALTALGRRAEAMRVYHRLVEALRRAHDIAPLAETRRLYEEVRRGSVSVKGLPPVPLTSLLDVEGRSQEGRDGRSQVQVGRQHQSPLVGREEELETLRTVMQTCEQQRRVRLGNRRRALISPFDQPRQPQCVLLAGEAGIGKTRLAEEVGREAQQHGWAIAWSRVYAQESNVPYRPWTEVLRNAQSRGFWQIQEISHRPLLYQPLSILLPELNALPHVEFANPLSPEDEQRRLWEATLDLLTMISERTPLLIVLDDMHWADSSSCELLAYLVRHLQQRAIMVIATYRDTELPEAHPLRTLLPHLQREQVALRLEIEPLSEEQIASLVAHLPEPLVHYIQKQAGGNPFFAEELARTLAGVGPELVEQLLIDKGSGDHKQELGRALPLPETIAAVLDLRLQRLSLACQRLLSNASVLEGAFEFGEVLQLEQLGGSGIDEGKLLDLLEEALREGVLVEEGAGTRISYHFWHPLLGLHLYQRLSGARRASLHRRAARVLQQKYAGREAEGAATITQHLVKGGGEAAVIRRYAELAGDHAYALSSYGEAEYYYRLAIQYLLQAAQGRPLASWSQEERLHLADLYELLAYSLRVQSKPEEARHFYERLLEVRNYLRQPASPEEALYEAQYQAMIWVEIGWTWYDANNSAQAISCCERSAQILQQAHIEKSPAWASIHRERSYIAWRAGDYPLALQEANRSLQLFEQNLEQADSSLPLDKPLRQTNINTSLMGNQIDIALTHRLLGTILNSIGKKREAFYHLKMAITIFEQYNRYRDIAAACCNIGHTYLSKAQYQAAQAAFRRALMLAERLGDTLLQAVITSNLGLLAARLGNLDLAEQEHKRSLRMADKASDKTYFCLWNAFLATILQRRMKSQEAVLSIRKALSVGASLNLPPCLGFALVALGNMRLTQAMYELAHKPAQADKLLSRESIGERPRYCLERARLILERALVMELESETLIEGKLILTQVLLLLGKLPEASKLVKELLEELNEQEAILEFAKAQFLQGAILLIQGGDTQAENQINKSLNILYDNKITLEYAYSIYTIFLLSKIYNNRNILNYSFLPNLNDVLNIFKKCHDTLSYQASLYLLKHRR